MSEEKSEHDESFVGGIPAAIWAGRRIGARPRANHENGKESQMKEPEFKALEEKYRKLKFLREQIRNLDSLIRSIRARKKRMPDALPNETFWFGLSDDSRPRDRGVHLHIGRDTVIRAMLPVLVEEKKRLKKEYEEAE